MNNPTNFVRETIDLISQISTRFIELGARLYKIREERLWEGSYNSFQEFLDTANITKGNASILASIHRSYVVEGKVDPKDLAGIGYSNLYASIPLIERDGVERAVATASTLTRGEIQREVRDPHDTCGHEKLITICSNCSKRVD